MVRKAFAEGLGYRVDMRDAVLTASMMVLLAGCASNPPTAEENVSEIELRPGASETCVGSPCTVWFDIPAGTGTYTLMQDGTIKLGDYPAGKKVMIGNFYNDHYFDFPGLDVPKAHLFIEGGL